MIEVGIYCIGLVKFVIVLGGLLLDGIGDIMCIFLVVEFEEEIKIGFDILKLFSFCLNGINFIVCLSCLC